MGHQQPDTHLFWEFSIQQTCIALRNDFIFSVIKKGSLHIISCLETATALSKVPTVGEILQNKANILCLDLCFSQEILKLCQNFWEVTHIGQIARIEKPGLNCIVLHEAYWMTLDQSQFLSLNCFPHRILRIKCKKEPCTSPWGPWRDKNNTDKTQLWGSKGQEVVNCL